MFPDHGHRRIAVASPDDIATARRIAAERAEGVLAADEAARLDRLVAALAEHALGLPDGTLLIARMRSGAGVECLAYDRDPATAELPAPSEGDAPAGLGVALETVRAQADRFHIHATPGIGSALLARVLRPGADDAPPADAMVQTGSVMVERSGGEAARGGPFIDHWFVSCAPARGGYGPCGIALMIDGDTVAGGNAGVDAGAGAGEGNGEVYGPPRYPPTVMTPGVIRQVETVVAATVPGLPAPMVVNAIRRDLKGRPELGLSEDKTLAQIGRAAVAVLRFDAKAVDYTALGTVAGAVVRPQELTALGARWAMIGFNPLAPAAVHLLWGPGDHVVLYTGGCARLPALFIRRDLRTVEPTLAALVLLRDGAVCDDDHTILVLRNRADQVPASAA
ncbi:anti-sigma regulatory factor [Azospirillum sp. Sh1]|uniref:anti-sigma regulatory factor n=1 Tax=Azospirillum sp. Sh1 TaxID=2607285 RepID=UPI0011EE621C|nr:anti-sigma regulatory factor [Azospirillum sp. Sh1]KAA0570804.1 anti-sigma regulatory factor [Azospirillum sp. Sh1]